MESPQRNPASGPEIIPADPKARRVALALVLAGLVAGGTAVLWLNRYQDDLLRLARKDRPVAVAKALRLANAVALAGGAGLVAAGVWFAVLGRRICSAGRFPPPGMRVVRDTPVRTGAAARRLAALATAAAVLLILCGTVGMWYFCAVARALVA